MLKKKLLVLSIVGLAIIGSMGVTVLAKENLLDTGDVKKYVLMNEGELKEKVIESTEEQVTFEEGNSENVIGDFEGYEKEEKQIKDQLINIAKEYLEKNFKVDLDKKEYQLVAKSEVMDKELKEKGSTKISWFKNGVEEPEEVYVIQITEKGRIEEVSVNSTYEGTGVEMKVEEGNTIDQDENSKVILID